MKTAEYLANELKMIYGEKKVKQQYFHVVFPKEFITNESA
jgi:hypothetical protein